MNANERWSRSGLMGCGIDAHYDITAYTDHSYGPVIATVHISHVSEEARRTASERADLICQAPELKQQINAAIAAAVQAEREAKDALIMELYDAWKDAPLQIAQRADRAEAMTKAAAIRARSNGEGSE